VWMCTYVVLLWGLEVICWTGAVRMGWFRLIRAVLCRQCGFLFWWCRGRADGCVVVYVGSVAVGLDGICWAVAEMTVGLGWFRLIRTVVYGQAVWHLVLLE